MGRPIRPLSAVVRDISDPEDRLTQIGSNFSAGNNGDGLRAWKQVGSTRTYFVYDGAVPLLEVDTNGTVQAINTFGAAALVSRRTGGTTGPTTFYTFDPLGNVCQRTNSSAAVTSTDTYDAFGQGAMANTADVFGFGAQAGYYHDCDAPLSLYLLGYRNYVAG
jgi:hypothetical protein